MERIIGEVALATTRYTSPDYTALDLVLSEAEMAGARQFELSARHCDVIFCGRVNPERLAALEAVLRRHRLQYCLHAPHGINFAEQAVFDRHWAAAVAALDMAQRISANPVLFHPGSYLQPPATVDERSRLIETEARRWRDLTVESRRRGLRLVIENTPDHGRAKWSFGFDLDDLKALILRTDCPDLAMALDYSHWFITANRLGLEFAGAVGRVAPLIGHLHIHDSFGVPQPLQGGKEGDHLALGIGDLHLPPGYGGIPFQSLTKLSGFRKETVMTIELNGRYWSLRDDALKYARAYAEAINAAAGKLPANTVAAVA